MGAWGPGSFENDAALDFAAEIESPEDLLTPLTLDTDVDEADADHGCRIIVVAECVAAMRGHPSDDMPDDLASRVETFGKPSRSLYLHARHHLAAVRARGELLELWSEEDQGAFVDAVHELITRLSHRPAGSAPAAKPKRTPFYEKDWFKEAPCCFCKNPLGEADFVSVSTKINEGKGSEVGFMAWAHLDCLNQALHPTYRMRPFSMHPEDVGEGDEIFDILDAKPTLED